jgi:hypothetical protein
MSMSAEPDDSLDDEVLQRAVRELRRPVQLDPGLDQRVLAQIRAEPVAATTTAIGRRWRGWMAGAAVAAGLLIAVALPERQASEPAAAAAPERTGGPSAGRPVRLRLTAPAQRVAVVGDFNDWDPAATPLRRGADGGTWVVELRLPPGRYHYTFLIDGRRWARDPSEPPAPESDFGAPVSVLTVS